MSFFKDILDFYCCDSTLFSFENLPIKKVGELNFRKGEIDEWRKVLTKEQQMKLTQMMPEKFFTKFKWDK